jgi:hypothetical protein
MVLILLTKIIKEINTEGARVESYSNYDVTHGVASTCIQYVMLVTKHYCCKVLVSGRENMNIYHSLTKPRNEFWKVKNFLH